MLKLLRHFTQRTIQLWIVLAGTTEFCFFLRDIARLSFMTVRYLLVTLVTLH